jgi:radical SAM protein with 4Fe4S-binding SPASM domain
MIRHWQGHGYITCYSAGLQTCITPDGSVWTCVNKREHAAAKLGNLRDESFGQIWQRGGPKLVNDQCRVLCRGHVPNLALQELMREIPHGKFI